MAIKWNRITSGFDCEDETINFGTRNFAENNGSIYETWTLATIKSDNDNEHEIITQNPNVKATIWYERMCIAVDTCITIFYDQTCRDVLSSIGFDSPITSYCLSMDGICLFVSVEEAMLHCFILIDGGRQIFNIDMSEYNCSNIVKIYLHEENNIMNIIATSSCGNIYRINGIDRDLMNDEITDYHQITKSIDRISTTSSVEYCTQINFDGNINESLNNDQLSMIIVGKELYLLPDEISCSLKDLPFQYTKVQFFNNYKAMICLRTDGCLSIVCMRTLLGIKIWDGPVKDFLTIRDGTHDLNQMLVLMAPLNNESSSLLHLMSFPDFNIIFTMSVSSLTYLVDIVGGTIDRLLYLEGIKKSDDSLDVIRIKAIEEGMPEFRLQRLLRQRRFNEALTFAMKFNLDTESIHRAEASFSMNNLRLQINSNEIVDWNKFKSVLDKINDITFVHECCKNTLTYNYKDTRNLLEYLRQRIVKYINEHREIDNKNVPNLLEDVNNTLKKLETFETIQKIKINKQDNNENVDITEWNKFCKANLLDECIKYLSCGELDAAALIWIRHTSSFSQNITEDTVIDILNGIPANLLPSELWPWLHHFIPSVTSFIPGSLAKIIHWSCEKTKTFETFHRGAWPDIGIKFANGLIDLLHFDDYNVCFQFHQQYANKNSQFHQLAKLIQAMTELLVLKSQYKVVVPLSTYLGDPTDVINLLLNKVHIDGINGLMRNFLQQYMLNNSLQNDKVLSNFIQNTLRNSKDWWFGEKAPWDKRLAIVIGYIHNIQNRLQQTLFVLKKAPVPWSEVLIQLAQQSYVYDHPLVTQIRFENNYVTEKLILKKYGFAHTGQCTIFFHSIVKQNRPSMINDIFESTKADRNLRMTILHFCISYHLKQGNIDSMINIFKQLTDDIVVECCQQLVYVTQSKLNFSIRQDNTLNCDMTFEILGAVDTLLREIIARNSDYSNRLDLVLKTITNLLNLYRLNKELKICTTMNNYIRRKDTVLVDYINKLTDENNCDIIDWSSVCKKIERANNLLCLPKFFGLYCLLDIFKHSADLKSYIAIHLSDKQIIMDEELQYANKICTLLVQNPVNDLKISECLRHLYSSILLVSDDKYLLSDNLRLESQIDAYNIVVGMQTIENDSLVYSSTKNSINFYPIYRDASVLSGCDLLPLLKDVFEICSFYRTTIHDGNSIIIHDNEANIESLIKSLLDRVKSAQNEHCDFSLLNLIATVYFELYSYLPASENSVIKMRVVLNHCVDTMFKKVISSGVFDMQLGLICLFLLPETETQKLVSSMARIFQIDYSRDQFVKNLGYEYSRLTNDINYMEKFKTHRILHYWGKRLSNYGISHREILQSDTEKKREILRSVMISNKPDTLELMRDFCKNFGFNMDDCYLLYLERLLTSWKPNIIINDQGELNVDKEDVKKLTATCKQVASEIINKEAMKRNLAEMIMQINFYHYEIFLILLELSEEPNVEATSHLCFLQNYTRIGAPTDIEYEEWKKFSQENESLPTIAKWRLPFLPKVDQNKLIIPELNLRTYNEWLKISSILNIPVCNICTLAVKGAVTEAWKIDNINYGGKNSTKWSINLRNSTLLKDIKTCIDCMTGPDGLYYGTAALYYVVNHTPPGADLVAAAKECFIYSQRWQQECNQSIQSVNTKLPKIKEKYLKYMSKHVLHTHGLGQEKYLNLVDNPEKLMRELYNDETIPYRYKCAISNRPDINSAVDALGSILPLNLIKIRLELLNDWLQPWEDNWDSEVNDSISTNFLPHLSASASTESFVMDNNLLRACYIAGSGDTESFINYLIAIGFPEDYDNCTNPCVRFRALRVLQSITSDELLQDYVKRDSHIINEYMKTLKYLSELERLGLGGYSVKGFDECSKNKLVQVLINSQYCTPRALALIPQLYIDYKINNYNLLAVALERMVELSLVKELKSTLSILGSVDCIIDSSGYIAAWQIVVTDSFNKLDQSCTETIENCIDTLRKLHACPIVDKLEFNSIINCCVRAKQWHLAAALLPVVIHDKDKEFIITELVRSEKLNDITTKLMELKIKGILIVRQALMILEQTGVVSPTTKN